MNAPNLSGFGNPTPVLVPNAPAGEAAIKPVSETALVEPHSVAATGVTHKTAPTANEYVATLFVFMLATFVGLDVIRRVSRLLHTPLMSLTNAISAIAVVGSLLIAGQRHGADWNWINLLGLIAITASVTNIVSGFLITDRMLKMFKKREVKKP
jgi:NAD(P) transhydrogenase subunit alpha